MRLAKEGLAATPPLLLLTVLRLLLVKEAVVPSCIADDDLEDKVEELEEESGTILQVEVAAPALEGVPDGNALFTASDVGDTMPEPPPSRNLRPSSSNL